MAEKTNTDPYGKFFDLIYKNFKLLKESNECYYHYWFGDKDKVIQLFKGMSFPSIVTMEKIGKLKAPKLMVICSSDINTKMFYGASIFNIKSKDAAEMISFVIHPGFRNKRFGTRLMESTDEMLRLMKINSISMKYRTYWKSNDIWEKLLNKTGWSVPELQLWYFTMPDVNTQFGKDWFQNAMLQEPFNIREWDDECLQDLKVTLSGKEWENIVPRSLSPFQMESLILPHASLLLRKGKEIVGWIICHQLQPDIVQATTIFVHPMKAKGQGMVLMAEAAKRRKLGAQVIFMIEKHNKAMLNLVNKYIAGGETQQYELRIRTKRLSN